MVELTQDLLIASTEVEHTKSKGGTWTCDMNVYCISFSDLIAGCPVLVSLWACNNDILLGS